MSREPSRERPILFSAPMVRALLAGTKTQTRRVAKIDDVANGKPVQWVSVAPCTTGIMEVRCPYGEPGDLVYARETWAAPHAYDHLPPRLIPQDARIHYAATEERGGLLWRPSIHMPRWASRITLDITVVRVERLQEISEADAMAEGVHGYPFRPDDGWPLCTGYMVGADDGATTLHPKPQDPYRLLWEQINGRGSWDANPFVWVLEFRRQERQ